MPRDHLTLALSLLIAAALSGCGTSAHRPACATSAVCGSDRLCVTGVCRPKNEIPTEAAARKLELLPDRWTVVTSQGEHPWSGADVPLGRSSLGQVLMLLHFDSPLREQSRIVSAFLVLEPMDGATAASSPVPVGISRILQPWDAQASWSRLPGLSAPESTVLASTWGGRTLYVDVTRQVVRWRERRSDDHGLALVAAPHDPIGASYSLGVAGGRGPRLHVYLR